MTMFMSFYRETLVTIFNTMWLAQETLTHSAHPYLLGSSALWVGLPFPVRREKMTNSSTGNLPFSATEASVAQHFVKLHPRAIRHRTTKETGKSKGFAFVEFDGYDRMKTCLQMYHHSDFNDGLSPVRKINVELTWALRLCFTFSLRANNYSAGGGGAKSEERRSKLSSKNEKLNEQRKRRALEEAKLEPAVLGLSDHRIIDSAVESTIHPSRRKMVTRG